MLIWCCPLEGSDRNAVFDRKLRFLRILTETAIFVDFDWKLQFLWILTENCIFTQIPWKPQFQSKSTKLWFSIKIHKKVDWALNFWNSCIWSEMLNCRKHVFMGSYRIWLCAVSFLQILTKHCGFCRNPQKFKIHKNHSFQVKFTKTAVSSQNPQKLQVFSPNPQNHSFQSKSIITAVFY